MKKKGCFLPKFRFYQQSHHNLQGFTPLEILSAMFHTRVSQSKNYGRWHTGHTKDLRKRQRRFLSLTGFTLTEILIAMVILSSATVGLFASFVAAQKFVARSRHRLQAANAARIVLDDLRAHVNQSNWDDAGTNFLACPGGAYPCTRSYTLPADYLGTPWNWSATYIISLADVGGIQMRQVDVTIHWDEPVS